MTDPVGILRFNGPYEDNTINGQGICTFSTVESEIPTFAATSALVDSKSSRPVNMEGSVREVLGKNTVLKKKKIKEKVFVLNCTFSGSSVGVFIINLLSRL